jgi:hypothetical protein
MRGLLSGSSVATSANPEANLGGVGRHLIGAYRLTCHCAPTRLRDPLEKKDVIETGLSYDHIEVLLGQLHEIRSATS